MAHTIAASVVSQLSTGDLRGGHLLLTQEENQLLCRVGKGTPMGELLRRFWLPVLLTDELPEPDCSPIRIMLLGEPLVAFRDTNGVVGLLDNYCPHRRASLFFGRNEECGLRCVYHGWKFDVEGNCVDMPSEPAESNFKDKVRVTAYPTQEQAGLVWTYMGPPDVVPQMPQMEWMLVPDSHRYLSKYLQECNFVQGIEGEIDSSHLPFLHARLDALERSATATTYSRKYTPRDTTPQWKVLDTDYGIALGAKRNAEADSDYWRINHVMAPVYTTVASDPGQFIIGRAWVPMDDEHTWVIGFAWCPDRPLEEAELAFRRNEDKAMIPGTWQRVRNHDNDYLIDRHLQKTVSFTGICTPEGQTLFRDQDAAIVEGMGSIVDRRKEHLGTSDNAIIRMRRRLLGMATDLQEGEEPYAALHPEVYQVRPWAGVLPKGIDFDQDRDFVAAMEVKI